MGKLQAAESLASVRHEEVSTISHKLLEKKDELRKRQSSLKSEISYKKRRIDKKSQRRSKKSNKKSDEPTCGAGLF